MIFRTITDSLFATDDTGTIQPYLVETVEPSEDLTVWTMTIREGISFHDGTPLDGAAVKYNIDTCRFSPLTGPAFLGLADVTADGQDRHHDLFGTRGTRTTRRLREEVCGMMFSPTWMATLPNNPLNNPPFVTEEEQAELDLTGDPAAPVGSGAFVFESYTPGNGNSFKAVRNEDYWRGDGAELGDRGRSALPRRGRVGRSGRHPEPLERSQVGPVRHHPHRERRRDRKFLEGDADFVMLAGERLR